MQFPDPSHVATMRRLHEQNLRHTCDLYGPGTQDTRGGSAAYDQRRVGVPCRYVPLSARAAEQYVAGGLEGRQPYLFIFAHDEDVQRTDQIRLPDEERRFEVHSILGAAPDRPALYAITTERSPA